MNPCELSVRGELPNSKNHRHYPNRTRKKQNFCSCPLNTERYQLKYLLFSATSTKPRACRTVLMCALNFAAAPCQKLLHLWTTIFGVRHGSKFKARAVKIAISAAIKRVGDAQRLVGPKVVVGEQDVPNQNVAFLNETSWNKLPILNQIFLRADDAKSGECKSKTVHMRYLLRVSSSDPHHDLLPRQYAPPVLDIRQHLWESGSSLIRSEKPSRLGSPMCI